MEKQTQLQELDRAVYARFLSPMNHARRDVAGVEIELPIVNRKEAPVDFAVCQTALRAFLSRFSFSNVKEDDDGRIFFAECPKTHDTISFDCSYNTLEFSFAPEHDIRTAQKRFEEYYIFVQDAFQKQNHTLTGMGINPHYRLNRAVPVANERYRMLLHHLRSYQKYRRDLPFHSHPEFGLFSCAAQVQLDVSLDNFTDTLNTFTALEPLKALLFANSLFPETPDCLLSRDAFWENSLHGLNPHNVGMLQTPIRSADEMVHYIESMSLYCVHKDGKYLNFAPTTLYDYMLADRLTGEYYDPSTGSYQKTKFTPDLSDIADLRSFKMEDLTFRGTVECRRRSDPPF